MLELILGPQRVTGDWFDTTLVTKAKLHGEACPVSPPTDESGLNSFILLQYYDLPLSLYIAHARTGDPVFLTLARKCADAWWQHPTWIGEGRVRKWPDEASPPPRHAGIGGLICRAMDGRPEIWDWINSYSTYFYHIYVKRRATGNLALYDVREGAFTLRFITWLSKVLPDSFPSLAGTTITNGAAIRAQHLADVELGVKYFGDRQRSDGAYVWNDEFFDKVEITLTQSNMINSVVLEVKPLHYPVAAGQAVQFEKGGLSKTRAAAPVGATLIQVEPLSVARLSGDKAYVDDGTLAGVTQPFIDGILLRTLCDAHQVVTTESVKLSIKTQILNGCRHLYSAGPYIKDQIEQNSGKRIRGFHYFYHGGTTVNPTKYAQGDMRFPWTAVEAWWLPSARQAISTIAGAFGYAFKISGDEFYRTAGNELWDAAYLGTDGVRGMMGDTAKNFNQNVWGSSSYRAWLEGAGTTPPPQPTPDPLPAPAPTPSPDGFKGTKIIDSQSALWTLGSGMQTLRNGIHVGGGLGSIYKYLSAIVYVKGTNADWFKWTGTSWVSVGATEPGTPPPPPLPPPPVPAPTPTPSPTTRTAPWPKQQGQWNALLETERVRGYYLRRIEGGTAIFEKLP